MALLRLIDKGIRTCLSSADPTANRPEKSNVELPSTGEVVDGLEPDGRGITCGAFNAWVSEYSVVSGRYRG